MKKRILSILLAMCMLMSLLPVAAFAVTTEVAITGDVEVYSDKEGTALAQGIIAAVKESKIILTVGKDVTITAETGDEVYLKYATNEENTSTVNQTMFTITDTDGTLAVNPGQLSITPKDATRFSEKTYTVEVVKEVDQPSTTTDITAVEISLNTEEITAGDNLPTATITTTPENGATVATEWTLNDETVNDSNKAGTYTATFKVTPGDGFVLAANVAYEVNGKSVTEDQLTAEVVVKEAAPEPSEKEITKVDIVINTNTIKAGADATFPEATVTTDADSDDGTAAATVKTTWTDSKDASAAAPTAADTYTATFVVDPAEGYKFASTVTYTVNGAKADVSTLTATVKAVAEDPLNITVAEDKNGEVKVEPKMAYEGDKVTITAKPNQGYEVGTVEVTYAGDAEGATEKVTTTKVDDKTYTFLMPTKVATVTVTFKEVPVATTYDITIAKDIANGTVTTDPADKAAEGTEVTVTAKPSAGYALGEITVTDADGASVKVTDGKFIMPAKAVTVSATFTETTYTIKLPMKDANNNEVTADKTEFKYGDTVTLTVITGTGYGLDSLLVDGKDVTNQVNEGKYTFTMPAKDVTVTATFAAIVTTETPKPAVAGPAVGIPTVENEVSTAVQNELTKNAGSITFTEDVLSAAAATAATNATVKTADLTKVKNTITSLANKSPALTTINEKVTAAESGGKLEDVNVVTQLYMQVKITDANTVTATKSVTFEITPMVQNVLTTAAEAKDVVLLNEKKDNATAANAIAVGDPTEAYITADTKVTLPLPADFSELTSLWVKHVKDGDHFYLGEVKDDVLSFTTNGFSPFTVYATAEGTGLEAQIDNTGYATLEEAIDSVVAGKTTVIKLLANVTLEGDIEVGRVVTFTIEKGKFTITGGSIVAADGFKNTGTGDSYVFVEDNGGTTNPPSGGGGGGGVSSNVTIDRPTNGKVTVTPTAPSKGATVTINLTPDTGYQVGTVTVTDKDGKAVELTKVDDTHYTFVMPDGKVTVKATFTKVDTPPATGFTDVPADAYYADAVKWAVENNITNGLTATTFGPNNSCTRGQMVTFLWRAAGSPAATGTNSFADVASGEYYYNAVLWAVEKGITNGTTSTTFSPNATVNRGQTVTFLYRYAESPAATGDTSFTDVAADAYYADAVKWAVAEGITNGTSATTFAPASNCTRGQIVTFLYRQIAE